ncbi:MAG: hypothetical protein WA117_17685, partial [Verrucomicrobiia bacterium]
MKFLKRGRQPDLIVILQLADDAFVSFLGQFTHPGGRFNRFDEVAHTLQHPSLVCAIGACARLPGALHHNAQR